MLEVNKIPPAQKMKIIIAGSRTITNKYLINRNIFKGIESLVPFSKIDETIIISGGARGVDTEGESWAKSFGFPVKRFLPEWNKYGKKAGFLRNKEMINEADALIAIWDGKSKGTEHTINLAKEKNIPFYVEIIK